MGFDMILSRYEKGTVKEFSNFQEFGAEVRTSGEGVIFSGRSLVCIWFCRYLESIKDYDRLFSSKYSGPHESIEYPVKKTEYYSLLADLKEALTKKDEVAKAVDEAVGDCTVFGRSEIDGHAALICASKIMKLLPERTRMSFNEIHDWNILYLRDFWWKYWDLLTTSIEKLEQMGKDVDWDKEDVFFSVS